MHTSHVCVTLTSPIYFLLTLAQEKTAPGERLTSYKILQGLSAVRTSVSTSELPNFRSIVAYLKIEY